MSFSHKVVSRVGARATCVAPLCGAVVLVWCTAALVSGCASGPPDREVPTIDLGNLAQSAKVLQNPQVMQDVLFKVPKGTEIPVTLSVDVGVAGLESDMAGKLVAREPMWIRMAKEGVWVSFNGQDWSPFSDAFQGSLDVGASLQKDQQPGVSVTLRGGRR